MWRISRRWGWRFSIRSGWHKNSPHERPVLAHGKIQGRDRSRAQTTTYYEERYCQRLLDDLSQRAKKLASAVWRIGWGTFVQKLLDGRGSPSSQGQPAAMRSIDVRVEPPVIFILGTRLLTYCSARGLHELNYQVVNVSCWATEFELTAPEFV